MNVATYRFDFFFACSFNVIKMFSFTEHLFVIQSKPTNPTYKVTWALKKTAGLLCFTDLKQIENQEIQNLCNEYAQYAQTKQHQILNYTGLI